MPKLDTSLKKVCFTAYMNRAYLGGNNDTYVHIISRDMACAYLNVENIKTYYLKKTLKCSHLLLL